MGRRKKRERNIQPGWAITNHYQAPTGRWLGPGTELHIRGERGRFKFVEHVVSPVAEWVWVRDKDRKYRAFSPERVSRVHVTGRMR